MPSLAIKINVSLEDQEKIRRLLESVGEARKHPKFHCTVGFIEKITSENEATALGEKITTALQDHIDPHFPLYEVEKATHLFGHVIVFEPTPQAAQHLKEINRWLFKKVEELSNGSFHLNENTEPQNYTPHMTLWRARHPDKRLKKY
ncbi:MAG: hypothetical protein HYX35_02275 [Proteobacteria bacterium]|nr:hypothetical protein [Pseudomonadota bacterium]